MRFLHSQSHGSQADSQAFRGVPLRLVLVVPFVLQIFVAVGLTGWFSLRNGQQAVHNLATQLHSKTSSQVTHHLEDKLCLPIQVNQLNLSAITTGTLNLQDFDRLGKTFYQQMRIFDVGYVNFANPQGEFIGVERLDNGTLMINERSKRLAGGQLHVYAANQQGDRIRHLAAKPYNPLIESWYADAVKAKKNLWSKIYSWDDKPEIMSISSSYPVYSPQKQLLGVIGVDLVLSEFSRFLQKLQASRSGEIFIVERNGLLVASSGTEPPFSLSANKAQRLNASQSRNPLIKATADYLKNRFSNLTQIQTIHQLNFPIAGQQQFVQVTPWKDNGGLNWLIVVVVPESDFMEQIDANTLTTVLLCLLALTSATLLGLMTSRWISQRLQQLVKVSQEIAHGNLDQTAQVQGIRELEDLSQSFNQMAAQLKASFTELEDRVAQRTAELFEAMNTAETASRAKSEFLEAMSHELRTPLNAILGVAQILQNDSSLTPEHQEHLKITYRNGKHLLSLINDLLKIAKIGVDQAPSSLSRFDRDLRVKLDTGSQLSEESIDQRLTAYLAQMPPEWVLQLHQAATKGFDQDILQLATQIPADFAPLAHNLANWARDFRFDKVTDLIQQLEGSDYDPTID